MPLVPISLPMGMMNNGTYYDAKNRWHDGDRVRWHNNALRPIGGWSKAKDISNVDLPPLSGDTSLEVFRDGFAWVDNSDTRYRVFGSNKGLHLVSPDGTISDITPAGFVGSNPQPTVQTGYGNWLYGRYPYGSARPVDPNETAALWRWSFDTWGEDLIVGPASPVFSGGLYVWDASAGVGTPAAAMPNAPIDFNAFVVTDQRIVMGIGSSSEARLVRWSDREDYTDWTPTQLNYAGSYFLQGTGNLLTIDKVLDQILILSETDAHVGRWLGAPLVYGFNRVGDDCGPWNSSVVYASERFAMWPGRRTFWLYDGTLKPVHCEVMDFIAENLSQSDIAKAYTFSVPQFNEIWWCFQSTTSATGDVDTYVAYDYAENNWTKGKLDRSAAVSGEVYTNPLMVDYPAQEVYRHEQADLVTDGAWAETGPLELGQGDNNMAVRYIFPDTETSGDVQYTLYGQDQVTDTRYAYGPYAFNNPIATRAMGRSISMRVDGNQVPNWKVGGKTRFDVAPIGTGMR